MWKVGIVSKHQEVLDNQASAAYKKAIGNSNMTYELVPPDNHRRNMTTLLVSSVDVPPYFPFAPLVPTSPTGRTATSSPPTITTTSQLIHLCARQWPPWLHQTSICSNGDGGPCTWQTTQTLSPCRTLQKGVCPWYLHQTLLVLEILVNGNPSYSNLRRCVFQAQIPD